MKKREKEKLLNKAINEINDNMNGEVIMYVKDVVVQNQVNL